MGEIEILGNLIDLSAIFLTLLVMLYVFYILGKYQAFDKNPKFDREWWRMHYKLAGGEKECLKQEDTS